MSTVQTWTLWQRLPPRYQLTSRTVDEDEVINIATDRSIHLKPHGSSRPNSRPTSGNTGNTGTSTPRATAINTGNTGAATPRATAAPAPQPPAPDFMLKSNVPEAIQTEISKSIKQVPQSRPFPKRNSDYINHYQTQKRVNSARRRLAETPSAPAAKQVSNSEPDFSRVNTAPAFPVTSPATYTVERKPKLSDSTGVATDKQQLNTNAKSTYSRNKVSKEPTKVDVFQFDDSKSMSTSTTSYNQDRDMKPKKYLITDTKKATMYVDNGKVIYFGKSRHDLTALLKTQSLRKDRTSCFLADLRRDYLKHPKYESRTGKKIEADPKRIASERVDYNRKVEHILNYYNADGLEEQWSRPDSGYRAVTPRGSRRKGLSLTVGAPSRPPSRADSPLPERPETPGDFIRLNRQSKLHERHFYLRTPGIKREKTVSELEKCRCSMCRIELQLALVTGMSNTLGLETNPAGAVEIKYANGKSVGGKNGENVQTAVNIKVEEIREDVKTKERSANGQKVSFDSKELISRAPEHTLTISCTLPEMDQMTVSESGIESARTPDVESTIPDGETVVSAV